MRSFVLSAVILALSKPSSPLGRGPSPEIYSKSRVPSLVSSPRDSAKARLISVTRPTKEGSEWKKVSAKPLLDVTGDSDSRVADIGAVRLLSSGQLVALSRSHKRLLFIDPSGKVVRVVGRTGRGPGEFAGTPWSMEVLRGDSIVVQIVETRELLIFSSNGAYLATRKMEAVPAIAPQLIGRLADTSLVFWGAVPNLPAKKGDQFTYFRMSSSGKLQGIIGNFLHGTEADYQNTRVAWRPSGVTAVGPNTLAFAYTAVNDVQIYGADGIARAILRIKNGRRPVGTVDQQRFRDYLKQRASESPANVASTFSDLAATAQFPESFPLTSALAVDERGAIWLREYSPRPDDPQRWLVWNQEGTYLGWVGLPPLCTPQQILEDRLLATSTDASGEEHIVLYMLTKIR
jgi:hypothetical protein